MTSFDLVETSTRDTTSEESSESEFSDSEDSLPDLQTVSDSDNEELELDPTDGEPEEVVVLMPPKDFEDSYSFPIPNAEEKLYQLWIEEAIQGKPSQLGEAEVRKLEYMLESMQPYPGDPHNALQYKGCRFTAYGITVDDLRVHDDVREFDVIISKGAVARPTAELGRWYAGICCREAGLPSSLNSRFDAQLLRDVWAWNAKRVLELGAPYAGNEEPWDGPLGGRFEIAEINEEEYQIRDRHIIFHLTIEGRYLKNPNFDIVSWYHVKLRKSLDRLERRIFGLDQDDSGDRERDYDAQLLELGARPLDELDDDLDEMARVFRGLGRVWFSETETALHVIKLNGQQIEAGTYSALQRNTARRKAETRLVPKPLVVVVQINGHPARALIDSGSLGNFMSTTIVEQLKVDKQELPEVLPVQLAVQGSRSKVNYGASARFRYQNIDRVQYFDVMNLNGYDLILGTPWLFQHQVTIGLNPPRVVIGSVTPRPMEGTGVRRLASSAMQLEEESIEKACADLREYAKPLCRPANDTPLPPLRAINHDIPLIDENKIYPWRPSRCPEALKPQWDEKRAAYIKSGRWKVSRPISGTHHAPPGHLA
ncbi:hypothetical protein C0992_005295 [Termitomyces sp. T32_za158]|nr:hypothetical protein C0992_005295 [Termitomyces sp. T32_za158]